MVDIVTHNNFLDEEIIQLVDDLDTPVESFFDHPHGVFKGAETSRHQWFGVESDLGKALVARLQNLSYFKDSLVDGMQVADMIKPYDVHSDYIVTKKQVPISDPSKATPDYTTIIPLVSGENKTVIFDQKADYNDFDEYKSKNKMTDSTPESVWESLCGHCHDEDRRYLTIKSVIDWRMGDLFAFNRLYFHSSANFAKPKRAIVVWSSR
jgi:hypothetical protein|tara:strand:+ start:126 stop:752 length:627 start_codon:yes stop_codon:yes gene_type:complete